MKIWNTEELPDREQFAYWREVLCEAFVTLRPERPREQSSDRFPSPVTAHPLSTINVTTVQSRAHHVIRKLRLKLEMSPNPQRKATSEIRTSTAAPRSFAHRSSLRSSTTCPNVLSVPSKTL
jgi:hypothetical protein